MNLHNLPQKWSFVKNFVVCMVESPQYYSLEFLNHNQIFNAVLYSQQLRGIHENLSKCPAFVTKKHCASLIMPAYIQQESCRETYWI